MPKSIKKNREKLLWDLISNVRSNLDINKIKKRAVHGLSEVFNPDRCTIIEYDENQHTLPIEKSSEYLFSKTEKSMVGFNLDEKYDFGKMTNALTEMYLKQKQNVIYIPDAIQYIKESSLSGSKIEKYCRHSSFTTCVGISIFEDNKIKMFFTVKFKKKRTLTDEDIEFIKIYVEQVYIAIKQNKILLQFKQSSEKEKLLRKIVNITRSTLDVKKITRTFVFQMGKRLGSSRAFFSKYDSSTNTFSTPEESVEYLTSPDMISYRECGKDFSISYKFFCETLIKTKKMILVTDREEFIKKNNLEGTNDATTLRKYNIGSLIVVPIVYRQNLLGIYVFDYEKPYAFMQEAVDIVIAAAEQTSVSIYQAELFEKTKKQARREKFIREIVTMIRKSLNTEKIIKTYVVKMGEILKAKKIFFSKYDAKTDSCLTPDENAEYIEAPTIVRYKTLGQRLDDYFPAFCEKIKRTKENFIIPNIEKFFKESKIGNNKDINSVRKFKFNAAIAFPISIENELLGFYGFEYEKEKYLSAEELNFLTIVAEQTSIAMNQAELFQKNKKRSEREKILREIVNIIRKSMNVEKILHTYVFEMGEYLGASRIFFSRYNAEEDAFKPPDEQTEYLASPNIPSYKGVNGNFETVFDYIIKYLKTNKDTLIINDVKAFIKEHNLEKTFGAKNAKQYKSKAAIIVPVIYGDKLLGVYSVDYAEQNAFTQDDVDFVIAVSEQTAVALYQAELFSKAKRQAKNEALLRKIITRAATSLDMSDIKKMVKDIAILSKADRCYFVEVDIDNMKGKAVSVQEEYLSSPEIKSIVGYEFPIEDVGTFVNLYLKSEDIRVFDYEKIKNEKPTSYQGVLQYSNIFNLKSGIGVPFFYRGKLFAILVIEYVKENVSPSRFELDFLRFIGKQVGIAFNQIKLYQNEKQIAEREKLLRDIITATRSSLNIMQIKKTIVSEILKTTNADKISIFEYDSETDAFLPLDEAGEASSSKDIPSLKGVDVNVEPYTFFAETYRARKEIIYTDYEQFLKENDLLGSEVATFLERIQAKSTISMPVFYRDELLGALVIHFSTKTQFPDEQIVFVRTLAEQIGIALYQSKLFEKEKKGRIKEKLLNKIFSTIRKSLDLNEMKHTIVYQVGTYLKADRIVIQQLNPKIKEFSLIDEFSEYRASEEIKSYIGINFKGPEFSFFKKLFESGKELIAPDFSAYLDQLETIDESTRNWIKSMGIKSNYSLPIKYQDEHIASIYITYDQKQVILSTEELNDLRFLSVQIGLALNQAITYQDLQSKITQELLLRKVTETIRGSLDLQEIKQKIVEALGKTLDADRCYLRSFDIDADMFLAPDAEYLASDDIPSLKNVAPDQEGLRYFFEQVKTQDGIYPVEVTEDFIIEHQAQNKALDRYFKQANIKSDFAVPVWSKKGELTFLVLHYINKSFHITEKVKQLLIMLSKQISIALEQSDLYNELKAKAERERISRKTVDIIRSSLDIDQILISVAKELMGIFKVQRIFAGRFNFVARENFVEITSSDEIKSFTNIGGPIYDAVAIFWEDYVRKYKTTKVINILEEADVPPEVKNSYINMEVKSIVCVPIKSQDEIWGAIFLSSTDKYRKWTKDEIIFLESIVTQLDAAIRQAELYLFQKNTAYKESILRSIISEIKLTRNLNQAYGKLLETLAATFKLNRVLFLESSPIVPEELNTKYEYVIDRKDLSVNNLVFPPICMEKFLNLIQHLKLLTINDVSLCHPKNTLAFFEKYKIRAMMAVPLVKYNRETKVLGFIVLCSEEKRIWTEDEIDLINAISESVVSVIWEISKFIEIEDLRNSFVLTLAHDFQVPLIGEKLAIEYLLENSCEKEGKNKDLLNEILENNHNIIELLNKSVDIYNYEANKKILTLDVYEIFDLLSNAVYASQNSFKKPVNIELIKFSKPLFLKADKPEIMKVFFTLLENAGEHTPPGESVTIRYYLQNKRIIISIHNKGAAIPQETQEIIFNRYEMALAIERKIGAGSGLFLAKKIIEAHKGSIWFETNNETGTTFYVSLPQVEIKHV